MLGPPRPFSYSPRSHSQEDFSLPRRTFSQDEVRESPMQRNSMFRPSGRAIYTQRKEYSDTLNRGSENLHVRVEHLFTCELDGQELKKVDDCMAKLKRLDGKGRVWPQEMIMEVQGGYLVLSDIETKSELEVLPFNNILQITAVLDSCAYNSVLTVTLQDRSKRHPQVYLFQCEETGAELIKADLDKLLPNTERSGEGLRINLENIVGHQALTGISRPAPRPVQREMTPPPPLNLPPPFRSVEPENIPSPRSYTPQDTMMQIPDFDDMQDDAELVFLDEESDKRNLEIFDHILNDLEIFMGKMSAALDGPPGKKNGKKKKQKRNGVSAPQYDEYVSCLQKIKYGLNLLAELEGVLTGPTAADYVHIFFSGLKMIVPKYPATIPPTVISPLLNVATLRMLSQVVNVEEETLWRSLGDSWNLPRSRWADDVPQYIPQFYDGWQIPPPLRRPSFAYRRGRMSSTNSSQRFQNGRPMSDEPDFNGRWVSPSPTYEPPVSMRVIYDFMARNGRELSVQKGDVVQVIQKAKQWWLVRNDRNEEGNVPPNVLESMRSSGPVDDERDGRGPISLDTYSTPAEVTAWLLHKGFSRITVRSLGVLTGSQLLGMSRDNIRTVCPEEGGKVFFHLQSVKSSIALASEPSPSPYNGRY